MQTDKPYKRKLLNFSIKRDMQFKMIGKIFLILFVSLLLSGVIFYQFANQEITSSFQMFHVKARNFLDFLLPVVISSFAISLVAGLIGSLFFPKSIAGGVYRTEKDLQNVIENNDLTTQIALRGADQLLPLAKQINTLLGDFQGMIINMEQGLNDLEHNNEPTTEREIRERLKADLARFKTTTTVE